MKKWTLAATISASMLALAACNSGDEEVVASTSGGDITKEEFYQELKDRNGESVLQELVTIKVLEDNYEVTDKQVDEEIENMKEQFDSEDEFNTIIEQQIGDEDALREMVHLSLLQEAAIAEDITDEDLQQYYDWKNKEVSAQHILVDNEETAKEVKQKLDDGKDFEDLAAEYSSDTGTAEDGGDLGFFPVGQMVPAFEEVAFTLEPGEVSDPVGTDYGYHIIKVNDTREVEEPLGDFDEVKDELKDELTIKKVTQEFPAKMDELIKESDIDINVEGMEDLFDQTDAEDSAGEE